jgi:nicotinamide riboside transporter PnuC
MFQKNNYCRDYKACTCKLSEILGKTINWLITIVTNKVLLIIFLRQTLLAEFILNVVYLQSLF